MPSEAGPPTSGRAEPRSNNPRENAMLKAKYRDRLLAIGVALAAVMGSVFGSVLGAAADVFPSRPITIVVPYAAGGLFDENARAQAKSMRTALSQAVVIENVGGAGGS